jgi:hypothetical protein
MVSECHLHSTLTNYFPTIRLNVIPTFSFSVQSDRLRSGLVRDFRLPQWCTWHVRFSWFLSRVGSLLLTFRHYVQVPPSRVKMSKKSDIFSLEGWTYTFSRNVDNRSTLYNNSDVRIFQMAYSSECFVLVVSSLLFAYTNVHSLLQRTSLSL